jgi:hypothetical protein
MLRKGKRKVNRVIDRSAFLFAEYPIDLLAGTGNTLKRYTSPRFTEHYEDVIRRIEGSIICVIEHMGFANLLSANSKYGIPTVACIANIESFDTAVPLSSDQRRDVYLTAIDFADEFEALAQCEERLFISKVETGLIGGLGLASRYYPYVPVGEIRQKLKNVRQMRIDNERAPGLFLMLGSGAHNTTWHSFSWFVQQADQHRLPEGIQVVIGGTKTDQLLPAGHSVPGLELRGWLEQDELESLLVHAQAVLAPQAIGFGALTRLPELSCAGIPVIVSGHPTHAIDVPPGVVAVEDDWEAWCEELRLMAEKDEQPSLEAYLRWEDAQAQPMRDTLEELF